MYYGYSVNLANHSSGIENVSVSQKAR